METILKAVAVIMVIGACSGSTALTEPVDGPDGFVLVHSAWLGGWAWGPVASILEEQGHDVFAPDLPGHGANTLPPSQVTMDGYVKSVTDILDARQEPVILVGHSLGGIVVSQAAELRPEKVEALVYLCAFLLPDGASFMAAIDGVEGSMVLDNLVMAEDGHSVTIRDDVVHQAFAHDVPLAAFDAVRHLIVPQPTAPLAAPLSITGERWGSIPRYYIECTADRAIPPAVQQAMYTGIPVQRVFSLDTSHAPNFAAPAELAAYLMEVGGG
jgi:pimeloyl-ACP methyl ester carboxylesterase